LRVRVFKRRLDFMFSSRPGRIGLWQSYANLSADSWEGALFNCCKAAGIRPRP
jgi:hypothetical protein